MLSRLERARYNRLTSVIVDRSPWASQHQCQMADEVIPLFFNLCLTQRQQVPQLFFKHDNGKSVLVVSKIVGDIKAAGKDDNAKEFIEKFNIFFEFDTVSNGLGALMIFESILFKTNITLFTWMLMIGWGL